jgi:hypothetical protein
MKKKTFAIAGLVAVMVFLSATIFAQAPVPGNKSKIRIGTYDSRTVIFAWSRSGGDNSLMATMKRFQMQSDSAGKAHDSVRIKELSLHAISFQHLLHQSVFSSGSAMFVMEGMKDKLALLAKEENVLIILSKWEIPWNDPSVEILDLTGKVAALFEPKEDIGKMAAEISKQAPLPLQDMDIESELFDSYCKRFGNK